MLSNRAIVVFIALQILDVMTTLLGFMLGAKETNLVVLRFLHLGTLNGLIAAKLFAVVVLIAIVSSGRVRLARLIRLLNLAFAAIVTWNLVMIFTLLLRVLGR